MLNWFKKKCDRLCCLSGHKDACADWKTKYEILKMDYDRILDSYNKFLYKDTHTPWHPIEQGYPPIKTRVVIMSRDKQYVGFLYYDDGWDHSRKINMIGPNGTIWATYTNLQSVGHWIELDIVIGLSRMN